MAEITKLKPGRKGAKCPICGRPPEPAYRPFCSKRCADVDLGRWLGGDYRVATEETPDEPDPSGQLAKKE
ncbi:MAG TPA: DNA gyrase inhibitor YacG [Alphaproteobacteria bacterium]|nr:DNA gyrase inhibitor YacG [Alphaproteobacteria bacterium]